MTDKPNEKKQAKKFEYSGVLAMIMSEFEGGLASGTFAMAKTLGRAYWHFALNYKLFFQLVWPWLGLSLFADFILRAPYVCSPSLEQTRNITEIFFICSKSQINHSINVIVDFVLCVGFWVNWQKVLYIKVPFNGYFKCDFGQHELKITGTMTMLLLLMVMPNIAFILYGGLGDKLDTIPVLLYAAYGVLFIMMLMPFVAVRLSLVLPPQGGALEFPFKRAWQATRGSTVKLMIGYVFSLGPISFILGLTDADLSTIVISFELFGVVLASALFNLFLFAQMAVSCSYICCAFLSLVDVQTLTPTQDRFVEND